MLCPRCLERGCACLETRRLWGRLGNFRRRRCQRCGHEFFTEEAVLVERPLGWYERMKPPLEEETAHWKEYHERRRRSTALS